MSRQVVQPLAAGVPSGGSASQLLAKIDASSFNTQWVSGLTLPLGQNLTFSPDNTYDIGAIGANRPRHLYLAGHAVIGSNTPTALTLAGEGGAVAGGFVAVNATGALTLGTGGTTRWNIDASGGLAPFNDGLYDIGTSSLRPRNLFLAGQLTLGTNATSPILKAFAATLSVESPADAAFLSGKTQAASGGNAHFDGANWLRYDVAQPATLIQAGPSAMVFYTAPAGANPVSWTPRISIDAATGVLTLPSGSITTPMLAAGAVTQNGQGNFDGTTPTRTTVNSTALIPGATGVTLTTTGGAVLLIGQANFQHSVQGGTVSFGFAVDGAMSPGNIWQTQVPLANTWQEASFHYLVVPAAGSHTFQLTWDNNTAGTLTRGPWYGSIQVVEFKR